MYVEGHKLMRDGEKIGWFNGGRVYDGDDRPVGYFEDEKICLPNGTKLGFLQGDYLHIVGGEKIRLEDLRQKIHGGEISDLARAAAWIFLKE